MSRFSRMTVLNSMLRQVVIPVFYEANPATAFQIIRACYDGGARAIEFTNRGDFASDVFGELERACLADLPEVMLGVGSIVDAPTAALYIARGANFVVGPTLNEEVARLCNRRKVAYMPGCGSASEVSRAEELGCEVVKIFPGAQVGGPGFVKALLGPCPWSSVMPTGGVDATEESLRSWLEAGVVCVGIGSQLITKELVAGKNFDGLSRRVHETLAIAERIKTASGKKSPEASS